MTKQVNCGGILIGGGAPISIQSMTNTDTRDAARTLAQIRALAAAGCDIVRCAVPDRAAATSLGQIKKQLRAEGIAIPLVTDIHFDAELALAAIESGADKIRINPGNIGASDQLRRIAERAKAAGIPIRIGVNSGSIEKDLTAISERAEALTRSALRRIQEMKEMGFGDIVVSVKSSDVGETITAYRALSQATDCPLHIGVTEAGVGARALAKSAVGIGALLVDGIGDTLRVSLTGDPVTEVYAARDILASVGRLPGAVNIISCPTCGRCRVDLPRIAEELARKAIEIEKTRRARGVREICTVAVMGCAVNGPGEASHADFGVACGDGSAVFFRKGKIAGNLTETEIVPFLLREIEST